MISCIVLDQIEVSDVIRKNVLNDILKETHIESSIDIDNKIIIFIHNIDKIKIWEVAFYLEVNFVRVGYGFGKTKEEAKENAFDRLKIITEEGII